MYLGRKPNGVVIPRFVNVEKQEEDFVRGYSYQGFATRQTVLRGASEPGLGAAFKNSLRQPGAWQMTVIHH